MRPAIHCNGAAASAYRRASLLRGVAAPKHSRIALARLLAIGVGLVLLLVTGCRSDKSERRQLSSAIPRALEPPPGLLASFSLRSPREFYEALRGAAPKGAWYLPATYPVLVGQLLGLGPSEAGAIDDVRPVVGVVLKRETTPAVVIAIPLRTPTSLKAVLTTGANAAYRGVPSTSGILHLVTQTTAEQKGSLKLGLFDGHLLVGHSFAAIDAAGPYLTRNVIDQLDATDLSPDYAALHLGAKGKAFGESVASLIRARWSAYQAKLLAEAEQERQRRGDRPPDFADPAAVILSMATAIEEIADVFQGTDSFELVVDAVSQGIRLRAGLGASATAGSAPVAVEEWFAAVPAASSLAMVHVLDPSQRMQAAEEFAKGLQHIFGPRLSAEGSGKIRRALEETSKVLPRTVGFGLLPTDAGRCGFLSAQPVRGKEFAQALERVAELSELPVFGEPIAAQLGPFSLGPAPPAPPVASDQAPLLRVAWYPRLKAKKTGAQQAPALELWAGTKRGMLSLGGPVPPKTAGLPSASAKRQAASPKPAASGASSAPAGLGADAPSLELGIAALAPKPDVCWRELSRSTRSLGSLPEVAALLDGVPPSARWIAVLRSETKGPEKETQHGYAALLLARPSASASQLYAVLPTGWLELLAP